MASRQQVGKLLAPMQDRAVGEETGTGYKTTPTYQSERAATPLTNLAYEEPGYEGALGRRAKLDR